ncbi:hypothetical protein Leryth_020155, partial [Lithospermum erythrorhizon]
MAKFILISQASDSLLILLLLAASGNMLIPKVSGSVPVGACWTICSTNPRFKTPSCAPGCWC